MTIRTVLATRALLTLGALAALCACATGPDTTTPEEPTGLAIVVGAHANQPRYGASALAGILDEAITEDITITVITDEGTPTLFATGTLTDLPTNPGTRARKIREFRTGIDAALDEAAATTPETNPLEAIAQAARSLRTMPGARRIVVTSSMLQTTGALPMQDGLLDADSADILEQLDAAGSVPDLAGYTIDLLAVGETAPPQEPLDVAARARLEQLWVSILERAGATVTLGAAGAGTTPAATLPTVTPVPLSRVTVAVAGCQVVLPDSHVNFVTDTAEFLNEPAARALITEVGSQLAGCAGTVTVTGTTSSAGTPEGRDRVSTERAWAVATLLAEVSGRALDSFRVRGLGYDTTTGGCVNDRDSDGRLVAELAAQNRKVTITIG